MRNIKVLTFLIVMFASQRILAQAPSFGIYVLKGTTWPNVPGEGYRIAVDAKGNPWVANGTGDIYKYENNTFEKVPGKAKDIAIGGGKVWIIGTNPEKNSDFGIYRWYGNYWHKYEGGGLNIAVDANGIPWVTNSQKNIYRLNKDSVFEPVAGKGLDIGCGGGATWVIGTDNSPLKWNESTKGWDAAISGKGVRISVDGAGLPWVVNSKHAIYQQTGKEFKHYDGEANDIAIGGGKVYIIGNEKSKLNRVTDQGDWCLSVFRTDEKGNITSVKMYDFHGTFMEADKRANEIRNSIGAQTQGIRNGKCPQY
jgi:hypothetical protein